MSAETTLTYERPPAVVPSYLRAATTVSGGLGRDETIPVITARLPALDVRAEPLAKYRKVCGFAHSRTLPVTYPHVLAFPMHMAVMTHKRFPLKLLGLIHIRNEITQHREIAVDEPLDIRVSVGGHRDVSLGIEFDLVTEVRDASGALIWQESGAMLSRQKRSGGSGKRDRHKKKHEDGLGFEITDETFWDVPENIGRRYASAAGDYNPIHLSPWSAKLFGFPRAIATGMWTKARAAAELEPRLETSAYRLTVGFKKPIFLPSRVRFASGRDDTGVDFALTDEQGETLHLRGDVRYL